jgi:hypothetical protein
MKVSALVGFLPFKFRTTIFASVPDILATHLSMLDLDGAKGTLVRHVSLSC